MSIRTVVIVAGELIAVALKSGGFPFIAKEEEEGAEYKDEEAGCGGEEREVIVLGGGGRIIAGFDNVQPVV